MNLIVSGRTGAVATAVVLGLMAACSAIRLGAAENTAGRVQPDDLAGRVILLANSREAESVDLADFYADQRAVPRANIVALPLPETESISWREFIDQVYQPLQDELYRRGWIEGVASDLTDKLGRKRYALSSHRISYLVVCKGVPLKINNDATLLDDEGSRRVDQMIRKNEAAVDSELSLLAQSGYEITGLLANPYFNHEQVSEIDAGTVIKVSRLDGPSFARARGLVTLAREAEQHGLLGRYYVDLKGPHPDGDRWLEAAQKQLEVLGFDGDVERTTAGFGAAARFDAPVLYFGWYHENLNGPFATSDFRFPPGAVALHIHSFSARTLRSTTQGWCGPLIERGVTATVGNVFEPYLQLTHRPDLLVRALGRGQNFGDAVYYALPALSWQQVAVGDPLYRPFQISLEEQERRFDGLPAALSPYATLRRANLLSLAGHANEAIALLEEAMKTTPGLAVAISLEKLELREKHPQAAVGVLTLAAADTKQIRAGEWPLAREVAQSLAGHNAIPAALPLYELLSRAPAPTVAARMELLSEARAAAEAAGDRRLVAEFTRQVEELAEKK